MPKRLGYKTDACMMLIRREINEHMINEKINKSGLVNDLLLKWYERKLCHTCLGGVIHTGNCEKCDAEWIGCNNKGCRVEGGRTLTCECSWSEVDGF
jgi:hypothetical protein